MRSSIAPNTRAQLRRVGLHGEALAGLRQRRDRRHRVVDLVRDDADHALPDRDFLRVDLARELLQQPQPVRLAVQQELAVRDVEHLRIVAPAWP